MSGFLTSIELSQPVGQLYLSEEASLSMPFEDYGAEIIELSPSFSLKIDKTKNIVGFFSWEHETSTSPNEKDTSNSLFSGFGLQYGFSDDLRLSSYLQGGYYAGSGRWWDEEDSESYSYSGAVLGLQEELSFQRFRLRVSSSVNYSLDEDKINYVDIRAKMRGVVKAKKVPVLGPVLKFIGLSKLSCELDYRHKFKMEKEDQDILRGRGELIWEPGDIASLGIGGEAYFDITNNENVFTPFAFLRLEPSENFNIQFIFFYGRSVYTSNY